MSAAASVTQPGDTDYPFTTKQGAEGSILAIRKRFNKENLYEDPDFPASLESFGKLKGDLAQGDKGKTASKNLIWVRPHEICAEWDLGKPEFALAQEGEKQRCSGLDIRQGSLGICSKLASLGALTNNEAQLAIIVPEDNYGGFGDAEYCGAFHFRLFNMALGKFVDIVVDDRIPCKAASKMPAFSQAFDKDLEYNEFWVPLLEKAFAKYLGSYAASEGGLQYQAFEFFTGGFGHYIGLGDFAKDTAKYETFSNKVRELIREKQSMGIQARGTIESAEADGVGDGYKTLGLKCMHAYAVLGGVELKAQDGGEHVLLKIKNPWAKTEWKGALSDSDDAGWAKMEEDLRRKDKSGSTAIDEGVFWMDLQDVVKYFSSFHYCMYNLEDGAFIRSEWPASLQEQKTAMGDPAIFHLMPAFTFQVGEPKRASLGAGVPEQHKGKCPLALRISAGEAGQRGELEPCPRFKYFIHGILEGDVVGGKREAFYKDRAPIESGGNCWTVLDVPKLYLKSGKYLLTVSLQTDGAGNFPTAYKGKALPFGVALYTENKATLQKVN